MKNVKILGSGCSNCKTTAMLIEQVATEMNCQVHIEKVQDMAEIISYGVMSTPAVLIDDVIMHAGGVPEKANIKQWLVTG